MQSNKNRGVAVGRYVIMPDHMHFFVRLPETLRLGQWIGLLKQKLAQAIPDRTELWQRGFFDHVLRTNESYSEKWAYVLDNPVRKGLASRPEDWPFSGELISIDRV
jgi:REP element-mobilizing transposase RayT